MRRMIKSIANLIDGYPVECERNASWRCACGHFERDNICQHTEMAAAIHAVEKKIAESDREVDIQYFGSLLSVYRS